MVPEISKMGVLGERVSRVMIWEEWGLGEER